MSERRPLVTVLGASGAVGSALAADLAQDASLDLRLVDLDTAAVDHLASDRVQVVRADLFDDAAAEHVCPGSALLVNCLSLVFVDRVFELAVRYGIDYADLISEPTEEQRAAAEAAGILAVPGLGMSPGLSNVLVRHAANAMDLRSVEIHFAIFRSPAASRGALDTLVWEIAEYCPQRVVFQDGELVRVGPFDGVRRVDFGGELGELDVLVRPHPEPVTLPRNFPGLEFVAVRGTWHPRLVAEFEVLNRLGLLADEETVNATKEALWRRLGGREMPEYLGPRGSLIEVRGLKEGVGIRRTYRPTSTQDLGSYPLTGLCAAVGVRLMLDRPADMVGVREPELVFDPDAYLAGLDAQGVLSVEWWDVEDRSPAQRVVPSVRVS
ncbi:saccharopine dehydrogenase family protein [Blastococcus sp. SYSU D00695]